MSKKDLEDIFKKHNLDKNSNEKVSNQKFRNILGDVLKLQIKEIGEARKKLREDFPELFKKEEGEKIRYFNLVREKFKENTKKVVKCLKRQLKIIKIKR